MSRLPTVGQDNNAWGDILNDYLLQSHKANGQLADDVVTASTIAVNAVTTSAIVDDAITSAQIADNSVTTAAITDSAITTGELADGSVSNVKVSGIDATKLVSGLVPVPRFPDMSTLHATAAIIRATRAPMFGSPVTNRATGRALPNTSATATQTTRVRHVITEDCMGMHLIFNAWGNGELSTVDATIKAAVEVGGALLPITFDGLRTRVLTAGSMARSDPVGVFLKKGDAVWVRSMRTIVPGTWTANAFLLGTTNGEGSADSDVVDAASTAFTVPGSDTVTAWTALSVVSAAPSVARSIALFGGSISNGQNETVREFGGFILRCLPDGLGVLRLNGSGSTVALFSTPSTSNNAGRRRLPLAASCKYAWVDYGIVDVSSGDSASVVCANLLKMWNGLAAAGLTVVQSTMTVWGGGSTDGYMTVENQTVWSRNGIRAEVNDYIRSMPAPLSAVYDMADVIESERNSGKWKAAVGGVALTTDGILPSTVGHIMIADALRPQATAFFV